MNGERLLPKTAWRWVLKCTLTRVRVDVLVLSLEQVRTTAWITMVVKMMLQTRESEHFGFIPPQLLDQAVGYRQAVHSLTDFERPKMMDDNNDGV